MSTLSNVQVHLNKLECRGIVHLNCETRVLNKFNAHILKSLVLLIVMI